MWSGCSPADFADSAAGLIGGLDLRIGQETLAESGYLMPVPDRGDQPDGEETTEPDPDAQLRADMAATQGGTSLIATDAEG